MYYRITTAAIPKRYTKKAKCRSCTAHKTDHIHLDEMVRPDVDVTLKIRWFLTEEARKKYNAALVEKLEELWLANDLEPQQEILYADGKDEYRAVCLCTKKGFQGLAGKLTMPKISDEQARELMIKALEQWQITPTA